MHFTGCANYRNKSSLIDDRLSSFSVNSLPSHLVPLRDVTDQLLPTHLDVIKRSSNSIHRRHSTVDGEEKKTDAGSGVSSSHSATISGDQRPRKETKQEVTAQTSSAEDSKGVQEVSEMNTTHDAVMPRVDSRGVSYYRSKTCLGLGNEEEELPPIAHRIARSPDVENVQKSSKAFLHDNASGLGAMEIRSQSSDESIVIVVADIEGNALTAESVTGESGQRDETRMKRGETDEPELRGNEEQLEASVENCENTKGTQELFLSGSGRSSSGNVSDELGNSKQRTTTC